MLHFEHIHGTHLRDFKINSEINIFSPEWILICAFNWEELVLEYSRPGSLDLFSDLGIDNTDVQYTGSDEWDNSILRLSRKSTGAGVAESGGNCYSSEVQKKLQTRMQMSGYRFEVSALKGMQGVVIKQTSDAEGCIVLRNTAKKTSPFEVNFASWISLILSYKRFSSLTTASLLLQPLLSSLVTSSLHLLGEIRFSRVHDNIGRFSAGHETLYV